MIICRTGGGNEEIMAEIRTEAKISVAQAPRLEAQLKEALENTREEIVVNMEDTIYVSSVGLRVFASIQKKVNAAGRSMVLINVSPRILEIFEVTGFVGVLTIG